MPREISTSAQPMSPVYVVSMVILIIVSIVFYYIAPWIVVLALHRPDHWSDLLNTSIPTVEKSVLWNGKLCLPRLNVNFFNPGQNSLSIVLTDLETHQSEAIKSQLPFGQANLVADPTTLWCVTGTSVVRVQNGSSTETKSNTTIGSPETVFLYQGRPAVIENMLKTGTFGFQLWVWTGTTWELQGALLLPKPATAGSEVIAGAAPLQFGGATQVRALDFNGRTHWFCTDGTQTLYCGEDILVPQGAVSAIDPENAQFQKPDWIPVGPFSTFELGSDSQGLILLEGSGGIGRPSIGASVNVWRLRDGAWVAAQKLERGGALNTQLVSDGTRAYAISMTFTQDLAITELKDSGLVNSKLAIEEMGASFTQLSRTVQTYGWWTPYPVVILFALLASWLMSAYRESQYEYGDSTVELASVFRRTLAKLVDWLAAFAPILILELFLFGTLDPQTISKEIFSVETDFVDMLRKMAFAAFGGLIYGLVCLIGIGCLEGFWKVSPGKWLLGICVVRTTLRPCGFFRAVLRELMLIIDCVMCFGWLPGACCLAFTPCRQRIGDLLSDTIVVRNSASLTATSRYLTERASE